MDELERQRRFDIAVDSMDEQTAQTLDYVRSDAGRIFRVRARHRDREVGVALLSCDNDLDLRRVTVANALPCSFGPVFDEDFMNTVVRDFWRDHDASL